MKHPTIHTHETFSQNMVRLLQFYNHLAIQHLKRKSNVHENIHQTRLCFKRMRSLLRLGKIGLGEQLYRQYNDFYRDQSRALSQLRDLTALIETLTTLIQTRRAQSAKTFLGNLKNKMLSQRRQQLSLVITNNIRLSVVEALEKEDEEISKWNLSADARKIFSKGFLRTYRRGKRLFLLIHSNPDDHIMHEWRKQVKYFWYQLLVLNPLWPGMMTAWAKEVQTLSQMLGKHHDLVVLENALKELRVDPKYKPVLSQIRKSISRKKQILTRMSVASGSKIYFERPGLVGEKIMSLWK